MLQYVIAGLALGSIYAIASAGLVVTFESAGILNFAFGSMAYVVARFYYWFNSQHGWSTVAAGLMSILVVAPLLGVVLYSVLFRFVRDKSTLVKLVTTIGLSVALPPLADFLLGTQTIESAPGLALQSDQPFHVFGTAVTTDQVVTYGFLLFILAVGTLVLRATGVGLRVRAVVDSEALSSLSGTSPGRVAVGVWAVSSTMAGIAGILVAPAVGLDTVGMTTLMVAAFAAVVAARMRSLPVAIVVAVAMGVVTDVIQKYLPPNSAFTADIVPSVPFAVMLVFLIVYVVRAGPIVEHSSAGGPLDHAIRPAGDSALRAGTDLGPVSRRSTALSAVPILVVAALPLFFRGSAYWLGLVALGSCYAVTFLTFTVVTGEGGMLWLSQIVFAGAGALATAQFVTVWHVPVLLALVLGGVVAAVVGAVMGLLTIRLGELYVGLGTLTFGLLAETLIFDRNRFLQGGLGVALSPPKFAGSEMVFSYLALGVFAVFAMLIVNLRRSTSGIALRAVRDSEPASRTLGLSVLRVKVIVGALGAFVAAVGGGFLAIDVGVAQPQSYDTFAGLVWLAVVVTVGVRSITAAALSGMAFALLPGVFQTYVPARWGEVPAVLFGLGAVGVARNPEGALLHTGQQVRGLLDRLLPRSGPLALGAEARAHGSTGATGEASAAQPAPVTRPAAPAVEARR
ncbi:MAG TPA: ABC transporter permease [Acidimicrobiales bacterium]|nr:ABC transporter permease [Acidimicrobiales bacterium]